MNSVLLAAVLCTLVTLPCLKAFEDPRDVAIRAVDKVKTAIENPLLYRHFGSWRYEGGSIVRGLWELNDVFPEELDLEPFLHDHLNHFLTDPNEFGYKILNDIPLEGPLDDVLGLYPWMFSIGDIIALFPIGYADRLNRLGDSGSSGFDPADDLYVVKGTVERYVYGYPNHLGDGTVSRGISWFGEGFLEPTKKVLWVDDMFMGTALTTALSRITGDAVYLKESVKQIISFESFLADDSDSIYYHGYNNDTGTRSCCKWGRGNGWSLLAKMEALIGMEELAMIDDPDYQTLLGQFVDHSRGLRQVQSLETGLWPNVLTNSSTFSETSASGMFLTAFVTGMERGWLDAAEFQQSVILAWDGIASRVMLDGEITLIIGGTGIKSEEAGYEPTDTDYRSAAPGVGGVLRGIAAAGRWLQSNNLDK